MRKLGERYVKGIRCGWGKCNTVACALAVSEQRGGTVLHSTSPKQDALHLSLTM